MSWTSPFTGLGKMGEDERMLNCWNIPVSFCLWSALLNFVKLIVIKAYTVKKKVIQICTLWLIK